LSWSLTPNEGRPNPNPQPLMKTLKLKIKPPLLIKKDLTLTPNHQMKTLKLTMALSHWKTWYDILEAQQNHHSFKNLIRDFRGTRESSLLSVAISLDTIVTFIANPLGWLCDISNYKTMMRDLQFSKQHLMSLLIGRTNLHPLVKNKNIFMDWCTYQPFIDHYIKRWFIFLIILPIATWRFHCISLENCWLDLF